MRTLTAKDFTMQFDATNHFRFVESEDATIMAWGHRDPDELLDEVFIYDKLCDPSYAERGEPTSIAHLWAVRIPRPRLADEQWWISWGGPDGPVTESTPGAFAVTIWNRCRRG